MIYSGIDISKQTFDVALSIGEDYEAKDFTNNMTGNKAFHKWVKSFKQEVVFCMEATGIYGVALAKFLHQLGYQVVVINPIKTHAFAKLEMQRNKTDAADAQMIARYCKYLYQTSQFEKNLFKPKGQYFERLQCLVTRLDQLKKMQTQENNRLGVSMDKVTAKMIKSVLKLFTQQIKQVEDQMRECQKHDEQLDRQVKLLISIDGVGEKTAWAILAYVGDISMFANSGQVACYAGLNPRQRISGTSLNKSGLSKMGHKRLRKSLYMPAVSAIKHNPIMVEFYEKLLRKGKPTKVALSAVMRKLLVISYGVLKSGKAFDANYKTNY